MCDLAFAREKEASCPGSGLRAVSNSSFLHPLDDGDDDVPLLVTKITSEKSQASIPTKQAEEASDLPSLLMSKLPTAGKGKTPAQDLPASSAESSSGEDWWQLPEAMAAVAKQVYGIFAVNSAKELQAFALPLGTAPTARHQVLAEVEAESTDHESVNEPICHDSVNSCDSTNDPNDSDNDSAPCESRTSFFVMRPSHGSWEWPLSRVEVKERIVMLDQLDLMAEVEELRMANRHEAAESADC